MGKGKMPPPKVDNRVSIHATKTGMRDGGSYGWKQNIKDDLAKLGQRMGVVWASVTKRDEKEALTPKRNTLTPATKKKHEPHIEFVCS